MMHYETVFIVNPVLSEEQASQTAKKYEDFLKSKKADIISKESWGLKKLAYSIEKKKSGFYFLFEYKSSDGNLISDFELDFKRDERVMRWMTVKLDKHAISYAEKHNPERKKSKCISFVKSTESELCEILKKNITQTKTKIIKHKIVKSSKIEDLAKNSDIHKRR